MKPAIKSQSSITNHWLALFTKDKDNPSVISTRFFMEFVVVCGLILIIGVPRLPALNRFVTTDETLWLQRSGNFYYSLAHHDFAGTFQKSHPGVTVMWAGLTSYLRVYPEYKDSPIGMNVLGKRDFGMPVRILASARQAVVLLHMLALGLGFFFARRLFGIKPALIGFLLIAFDPFDIALSRVLHLDALLADLMLLSLLAFLVYLEDRNRSALIVSAVAAGLAWLTKSPGLFLIPLIALLVLFDQLLVKNKWNESGRRESIFYITKLIAVWGVVGALVFYILWPAMWVDPLGSLGKILTDAVGYAEAGHESAVFFNGHIYSNGEIPDPSFYPISFLWRTTPVILLGLIAASVLLIGRRVYFRPTQVRKLTPKAENDQKRQTWAVTALLFFSLGFGVLMSLGLKKFDRYMLPSILPLDLVAGVSLVWLTEWAAQLFRENWRTVLTGAILFGFITVQAVLAWTSFPYFFSYYNPLLGGIQRAADVMQIGWGEGIEQAAFYINSKPNSSQLQVMAWYGNGSFSYFSKSRVVSLDIGHPWSTADWDQFNKSDYAVVYVHEWQRDLPAEVLDHLRGLKPEYSVWINGLEYVRVYKIP